jgi:hypothetical protein
MRMIQDTLESDIENQSSLNQISLDLDQNDDEQELRKNDKNVYFKLVIKLASLLNLNRSSELINQLIQSLFILLAKQLDSNNNMPNLYAEFHLCELIFKFECKYPKHFDSCLNQILSNEDSNKLTQKQRNYLLSIISCKFNSFKCKSAFKYQQIRGVDDLNLNLHLALNHSNDSIRSSAFTYILNELNQSVKSPKKKNVDIEFVKEQLRSKLTHESSPLVIRTILNFKSKLLDYLSIEQLLVPSSTETDLSNSLLLKFFKVNLVDRNQEDDEAMKDNDGLNKDQDVRQYYLHENEKWSQCRDSIIELIFTEFYRLHTGLNENGYSSNHNTYKKSLFFDTFLLLNSCLYELGDLNLLKRLKETQFYKDLEAENSNDMLTNTPSNSAAPNKKSFYSKSSITVTKLASKSNNINSDTDLDTDSPLYVELDEMFEKFLQLSVKNLISSTKQSKNQCVKPPSFFHKLEKLFQSESYKRSLGLIDLIAFELSVRLCSQTLFVMNTVYYLNLALNILTNLFGHSNSVYNLKFKARSSKYDSSLKLASSYSNFYKLCLRQSINSKNLSLFECFFVTFFKSVTIQQSNFVNTNSQLDVESLVNNIYTFLCTMSVQSSESSWFYSQILNKFIKTNFNQAQFYKFSLKFLIYLGGSVDLENKDKRLANAQIHTISLYEQDFEKFYDYSSKNNDEVFNSIIFTTTWCLTSENFKLRTHALGLLEKIQSKLNENSEWFSYLKKLLKHRQEIEIDGRDYVRTKSMNKIFSSSNSNDSILSSLNQFLSMNRTTTTQKHSTPFFLESDLSLSKFKYCLIDLFKNLKDDYKSEILDSLFQYLISSINESTPNMPKDLIAINKNLIEILVNNYLLTKKSHSFLNSNEKHFDFIVGYLNNHIKNEANFMIEHFKFNFIQKLAITNSQIGFFQNLKEKLQLALLKSCFDTLVEKSLKNTSDDLLIKDLLLSFELKSSHFVNLFKDRANLVIVSNKSTSSENSTTKEMKKKLNEVNLTDHHSQIQFKSLRVILELIQSILIQNDSKMEIEEKRNDKNNDTFIDIIPYLFLVLEAIETKLTLSLAIKKGDQEAESENHSIKFSLYLELVTLNSLLLVYKLNKQVNRSKLDETKFNIELLMQILQTKQHEPKQNKSEEDSVAKYNIEDSQIDRLNVQQHILILLSEIASIFPDKVLEHVIIMFIFVGNKLARKDDAYSFQVINQVIKSILPSIVNSVQQQQQRVDEDFTNSSSRLVKTIDVIHRHQKQLPFVSSLVCKILQSFVVSLPHIPSHRKTVIFDQLMQTIGLNDYLWITIVQSIDYYLVQSNDLLNFTNNLEQMTTKQQQLLANNESVVSKNEKKLRDTLRTCTNSMIALFVQFDPIEIIQSSVYVVTFLNKYVTNLFEYAHKVCQNQMNEKQIMKKDVYLHLACQLDNYNLLQMKYLAYNLLQFVNDLLPSEDLMTKLAALYDQEDKTTVDYTNLFQNLLEKILVLIIKLTQLTNSFDHTSKGSEILVEDLKKFHRAILNKSYDLMEKTINLLDTRQFIDVIKYLINNNTNLVQIRRRALVLLNNKLRKYEPNEGERTLLMALIDDLLNSIQLKSNTATTAANLVVVDLKPSDIEVNNQTILFSIKLICKRIGEHNPLAFIKVLNFLCENLIDKSLYFITNNETTKFKNINLLSSVLLCIGEVCLKLKTNSLKHLNQIMLFNLSIIDFIRHRFGDMDKTSLDTDLIDDFNKMNIGDGSDNKKLSSSKKAASLAGEFKNYELLILSSVTCLFKIVQNMSNFLSPYLKRMVYICCSLSYLASSATKEMNNVETIMELDQEVRIAQQSNLTNIETKLAQLRSMLATQIPLRLLAPILNEQSAVFTNESGITIEYKIKVKHLEFYMHITRMAIKNAQQEDLLANIRTLKSMFMNLFNLRAGFVKYNRQLIESSSNQVTKNKKTQKNKQNELNLESFVTRELNAYENHVINAFCEMTFKLSEDLFRPIFFSMYDWATSSETDYSAKDRLVTFYRATFK